MIEAWFSSSETITSLAVEIAGIVPAFAVNPPLKTSTASVRLKRARRSSNSSWTLIVPPIHRTAPAPTPHRSIAVCAAATTFGWFARPR